MALGEATPRASQARRFTGPWETLRCEVDGPIATLTLNRPERLNVMNLTMRAELLAALTALREEREVRALIVTGAGDAFCAGGDVNDFVEATPQDLNTLMRERSHRWFRALWELPIPTIAAVNGVAAGGAANAVLACDMVVASSTARFGQTFAKVGLMPDLGGLFLLPRAIGLHRAKAMCLTGELIDAERARDLGFVYEITEPADLLPRARALAQQLADGPQEALMAAKAALNRAFELSMDELLQLELFAQSYLFSTPDHRERLSRFLGNGTTPED